MSLGFVLQEQAGENIFLVNIKRQGVSLVGTKALSQTLTTPSPIMAACDGTVPTKSANTTWQPTQAECIINMPVSDCISFCQ